MSAPRRGSTGTYRRRRARGRSVSELQRTAITQPMSTTLLAGYAVPHPRDSAGELIQVTAFYDEMGRTVERWQFSETDVRWYHVEKVVKKRVMITSERSVPLG